MKRLVLALEYGDEICGHSKGGAKKKFILVLFTML